MTYAELKALFDAQAAAGRYAYAPTDYTFDEMGRATGTPSTSNMVTLDNGMTLGVQPDGSYRLVTSNNGTGAGSWTDYRADGTTADGGWNKDQSIGSQLLSVAGPLALMGGAGAAMYGLGGAAAGTAAGGATAPAAAAPAAAAPTAAGVAGTAGAAAPTVGGLAGGAMNLGEIGSWIGSNSNWLMPTLGALAGGAGSGPSTQTTSSDLPEWMRPYAQSMLGRADALSQQPFQAYPGQGVAGFTPDQQSAFGMIRQQATQGDPTVNAAMAQQQGLINGNMLGANPYIDAVAGDIADVMGRGYATGTRARMAGGMAATGNNPLTNSAAAESMGNADEAFGRSLGSTLKNLYFGNYSQERMAQDAAAARSPLFGNFNRQGAEGLLNMGGMQQQNQQSLLNWNRNEWDRQQQWPYQQLATLQGAINPQYGRTTSQTDPGVNPWQGALGGAMAGAGVWRNIWGQPTQRT